MLVAGGPSLTLYGKQTKKEENTMPHNVRGGRAKTNKSNRGKGSITIVIKPPTKRKTAKKRK